MFDVPHLLHAASRLGIRCGGERRTRWTTRASAAGSAASTRPRRTTTPAAMVGHRSSPVTCTTAFQRCWRRRRFLMCGTGATSEGSCIAEGFPGSCHAVWVWCGDSAGCKEHYRRGWSLLCQRDLHLAPTAEYTLFNGHQCAALQGVLAEALGKCPASQQADRPVLHETQPQFKHVDDGLRTVSAISVLGSLRCTAAAGRQETQSIASVDCLKFPNFKCAGAPRCGGAQPGAAGRLDRRLRGTQGGRQHPARGARSQKFRFRLPQSSPKGDG